MFPDTRIICLKSDPSRICNVEKNLKPYLSNVNVIDAVDAKTQQLEKYLSDNKIKVSAGYKEIALRGQIACTCSHHSIWSEIVENNLPMAIVIEDDTIINKDFENDVRNILSELPSDFDFCYLFIHGINHKEFNEYVSFYKRCQEGMFESYDEYMKFHEGHQTFLKKYPTFDKVIESKYKYITPAYYTWSTVCYIISNSGAKKLLNEFNVLTNHTDRMIPKMVNEGRLNAYCTSKLFIGNVGQLDLQDKNYDLPSNIWLSDKY